MAKKYPQDLLAQAVHMQDAWARIDGELKIDGQGLNALAAEVNQIRQLDAIIVGLENQLTEMRNQRDALGESAWDKIRRMRAVVKGMYGFDSPQYELAGGTRLSDRKSPRRTEVAAAD